MRTIATNAANDIYIGPTGLLVTAADLDAVLQSCAQAAKAQLGEMVFNADEGMPNFQTVWQNASSTAPYEAALRLTLMAVPNVIEVTDIEVTVNANVLFYTATIRTIYGEGVISNG